MNAQAMEMAMETQPLPQQNDWRSNQSTANANAPAADESDDDHPLFMRFLGMNLLTDTDDAVWDEDNVQTYTEDEIISLGFEVLDKMAGGMKRLNEHRHWKPNKNWWKRAIIMATSFKRSKVESPIGSGMWVMHVDVKDVELVRFLNHSVALVTAINELLDAFMESLSCTVRQKPSEALPMPALTDAAWVMWMRRNAIEQEQIKGFGGLQCCRCIMRGSGKDIRHARARAKSSRSR